jgi:hypothetical protein
MKSKKGLISVKQAYLKILSVILVLAIIGLSVVGNYGITWDEPIEVDMVNHNLEYIRENKPISEMSRHYGFYFNYISQLIYESKEKFFPATTNLPPNPTDKDKWLSRSWQITRVKHVVTFLFSLITYLSVVGIVAILAGIESAWLGALILALFPAFWGHSFFNPKDIPFAAMFTLGTFTGSLLLDKYFHLRSSGGPLASQNPPQNFLAFSAPIRSYYTFLGNNHLYCPSCRLEKPDYLVYRSDNPHVQV